MAPRKGATETRVLVGMARDAKNEYIVRSIINSSSNTLDSMDVLYALNAKKESAALNAPRSADESVISFTDSTVSLADLLEIVNRYFPDILPMDVLEHFETAERPRGDLGDDAIISRRGTAELVEQYGKIPEGERPFRDVEVPERTSRNRRVSQTVRNVLEIETGGV